MIWTHASLHFIPCISFHLFIWACFLDVINNCHTSSFFFPSFLLFSLLLPFISPSITFAIKQPQLELVFLYLIHFNNFIFPLSLEHCLIPYHILCPSYILVQILMSKLSREFNSLHPIAQVFVSLCSTLQAYFLFLINRSIRQ